MTPGEIHTEHPFVPPPEDRDPIRRFRGRLPAPVTIITAGPPERRTGLTISSLVVAEGEPGRLFFLVGAVTDLFTAIEDSGRFAVHVAEQQHRQLADRFAGVRPAPGGVFAGLEFSDGDWGPVLAGFGTTALCRLESVAETAHHMLVEAVIEHLEVHDPAAPLAYFRGSYRRLESPGD
jgi:flavin reductase (DIM6/NTAB) family NADH-FMN oxidoreductase RutF